MKHFWGFIFVVLFQLLLGHDNSVSTEIDYQGPVQSQPMVSLQETSGRKVLAHSLSCVEKAGEWLRGQQNKGTGLLRSYDMPGDCMAWTYDQGAGIIALLASGDPNTARQCADGMIAIRRGTDQDPNHVWVDGYDSVSGEEVAKSIAVGPNAWMGLALLKLHEVCGDNEYLSAAQDVANFILEMQVQEGSAAGSIPGGYDANGAPFNWTSTEHNADAIAFLLGLAKATNVADYRLAAIKIAEWLDREMWDPNLSCHNVGYRDNNTFAVSDFPELLDSQTWTLLALQVLANCDGNDPNIADLIHNGLPWIDQYLCEVNHEDCNLVGFAKVTLGERATDSFWAEGTAGYILAADAACHNNTNKALMQNSLRYLQDPNGSIPYSVGISCTEVNQHFDPCDIILAHFEAHPHCLYGQLGVYGDGEPCWPNIVKAEFNEPYSWYYEPDKPGYDGNNVHSCWQSFRLVNATDMCVSQDKGWASLGLDLGPMVDSNQVTARDVSAYEKFVFWARTDEPLGANIKVLFRDANSSDYDPDVNVPPNPPTLGTAWNKHAVELDGISTEVDLSKLVHVGLEFGGVVENSPGTIIYVDDMGFTGSDTMTALSNGAEMPAVFPQHWPYGSVAATSWFIFAELKMNPFAVNCEVPLNNDAVFFETFDPQVHPFCVRKHWQSGAPDPNIQPGDADSEGKFLRLLYDDTGRTHFVSAAFGLTAPGAFPQIVVEFDFRLRGPDDQNDADGFGVVLLPTSLNHTSGCSTYSDHMFFAERPALPRTFAVGFDVNDPYDRVDKAKDKIWVSWDDKYYPDDKPIILNVNLDSGVFHRASIELCPAEANSALLTITLTPDVYDPNHGDHLTIVRDLKIGDSNHPYEPYENRVEFVGRNGGLDMNADIDNIRVLYRNECLKCSAPEYADWVAWCKPKCWCYRRQCRGDADGIKTGPFWVAIPDLNLFRPCFNVIDALLVPECICADFDHVKTGPFRVAIPDLNTFRQYFNKTETFVPECPSGNYNFWETP